MREIYSVDLMRTEYTFTRFTSGGQYTPSTLEPFLVPQELRITGWLFIPRLELGATGGILTEMGHISKKI